MTKARAPDFYGTYPSKGAVIGPAWQRLWDHMETRQWRCFPELRAVVPEIAPNTLRNLLAHAVRAGLVETRDVRYGTSRRAYRRTLDPTPGCPRCEARSAGVKRTVRDKILTVLADEGEEGLWRKDLAAVLASHHDPAMRASQSAVYHTVGQLLRDQTVTWVLDDDGVFRHRLRVTP